MVHGIDDYSIILRLAVACVLGGLIGLERERAHRPAGLRTHVLVSTGSALMMVVSMYAFGPNWDPGRIAAQVVSGVGFLGAGTILREGATIKGLTTAASLWVVSGIGLAVGANLFFPAAVTVVVVMLTLTVFAQVEKHLFKVTNEHSIFLVIEDQPGRLGQIGTILGQHQVKIRNLEVEDRSQGAAVNVHLIVRDHPNTDWSRVMADLLCVQGVHRVDHER